MPTDIRTVLATILALALAILPQIGLRVLQLDKETAQRILGVGPLQWGLINGALLGLGLTSRLGTWCWYAVPYFAFILASPETGAVLWGLYALVRLGLVLGLAVMMRLHLEEDSMSRLSVRVLALRVPAMRSLSIGFTLVMLASFVYVGVYGIEPPCSLPIGEGRSR